MEEWEERGHRDVCDECSYRDEVIVAMQHVIRELRHEVASLQAPLAQEGRTASEHVRDELPLRALLREGLLQTAVSLHLPLRRPRASGAPGRRLSG